MKGIFNMILVLSLLISPMIFADSLEDEWREEDVQAIEVYAGSLENFKKQRTYNDNFVDVQPSDWYHSYVQMGYEYGLIDGRTPKAFKPDQSVTIAECIKLAVCIYEIYYYGELSDFSDTTDKWYTPYIEYAESESLLSGVSQKYDQPATRADVARIFYNALPQDALEKINSISENSILDINNHNEKNVIIFLYRAGIFTGKDERLNFYPDENVKRSEIATIVTRLVNAKARITL